jgi:serine/threonine-protein kinase
VIHGNGDGPEHLRGEMPSIGGAMAELRRHSRSHWLDMARDDQSYRWRHGSHVAVEEYFSSVPELQDDREECLVLICGEIHLRRERGEAPTVEEYERRFPELAADIKLQFDVDKLLSPSMGASEGPEELSSHVECAPNGEIELPGYEFVRRIGGGAFGTVFQARQVSLKRFVAIKVLANLHGDTKLLARQQREAEILARLSHPNVVHIYEVIDRGGLLYLVMEYIDGAALDETLAGKPLPPQEAAQLLYKLAETVEAVHAAGILHRDLKPSNVLLSRSGELKISDFSLAKIRANDPSLTVADDLLGTPSYMAPEQAGGSAHRVGPEADVYSLGAILYELLTGRPPFLAATVLDTLALIRNREPVPPRQLQPKIPRDLQTICLQCLNKAPERRYASASQLADDLQRFLNGQPVLARPPGFVDHCRRFIRDHKWAAVFSGIAAIAVCVFAATQWHLAVERAYLTNEALADAVSTADPASLPQLLQDIAKNRDRIAPILRERREAASPGGPAWVNLSVAELTADPAAPREPLLRYLPTAEPAEVASIVAAFDNVDDATAELFWSELQSDDQTDAGRLRLACLAARFTPEHASWPTVTPSVCRALVHQHPMDVATFTSLLLPARGRLVPALVAEVQAGDLTPSERRDAISVAARLITDELDSLVTMVVESEPDEFSLLFPALNARRDTVLPLLTSASATPSIESMAKDRTTDLPRDIERDYDRSVRRSATAAIAAWRLGDGAMATEGLRGANPSLRSWLIELFLPLGISTDFLLTELRSSEPPDYRQAIVLSLGQMRRESVSMRQQRDIRRAIVELFRKDPDPGVHAACRWLLAEQLDAADVVTTIEKDFPLGTSADRNWFMGANGHLMNVIDVPADFHRGSPLTEFWREDDETADGDPPPRPTYTIAIAAHEVTVAQFKQFAEGLVNIRYSPSKDTPINNIAWFDAARYCRWLSEQENVSDDQMVYPPISEIGPEMNLPRNWMKRTGYRLPTEREFEYACRGGTTTSRYCGEGRELLPRYAWHLNCSDDHAWPVGSLKPNRFGLFDMLGNVAERCQRETSVSTGAEYSEAAATSDSSERPVHIGPQTVVRGGDFGDIGQNIRAARRAGVPAQAQWGTVGFRVIRTLSFE